MSNQVDDGRTTILLHPQDQAILAQFCKDFGLSTSAAIRMIIREWAALKASRLVDSRVEYVTEQA